MDRQVYLSRHDQRTNGEQCDPPNTYPLSRQVLGRFAPGTRRASAPVPVIADVRRKIFLPFTAHPSPININQTNGKMTDQNIDALANDEHGVRVYSLVQNKILINQTKLNRSINEYVIDSHREAICDLADDATIVAAVRSGLLGGLN